MHVWKRPFASGIMGMVLVNTGTLTHVWKRPFARGIKGLVLGNTGTLVREPTAMI